MRIFGLEIIGCSRYEELVAAERSLWTKARALDNAKITLASSEKTVQAMTDEMAAAREGYEKAEAAREVMTASHQPLKNGRHRFQVHDSEGKIVVQAPMNTYPTRDDAMTGARRLSAAKIEISAG